MADNGGGYREREDTFCSTPVSQSSENLDLDLEELDDTEYDIPPVDNPPTLESILNEPDDGSLSDEELQAPIGLFHEPGDTVSVASASSLDSRGRHFDRRVRRSPQHQEKYGSILRHVILRGISSQLVSAADRVSAGLPTAMAVSSLVAVGTSHGLVLLFDGKQIMKWCLGTVSTGAQYGSVSALTFNRDSTRLLCGFAKGPITMWDLTSGKLLRTVLDAHPPGSAVLHIKFTDDPTLAVCSDSGGSVFELNFRRVMGVRSCESRCLFSGSRGEVCTIQPLQTINVKDHPLQDVCLLAMATMSKVIVVSIRPRLKVLFTHALQAKSSTLPLVAWQFVVIQVSPSVRIIDPVFSFARDNAMYFFQVTMQGKDILFAPLKRIEFQYTMLNFTWLNPRTLVALDITEHLHMIDVRTQEELEVIDLADVQLVYGSSHFKGLSTGGNVSKAMAFAGDQACYQSMVGFGGQVLLLGMKSVHLMTIRTWIERLDHLSKQHRYAEALALAQTFFEDRGKAVVGLGGKREDKMVVVGREMWKLLDAFVNHAVSRGSIEASRSEMLEEYFAEVIPICVQYHLLLEESFLSLEARGFLRPKSIPNFLDCLFGRVCDTFRGHPTARAIFLEALEPHILNDRLSASPIPPSIMRDFVEHYAEKGSLQALEACIVHLNVASVDIHQVMKLGWTHGLYDAILYIHNKAMNDFTGPLEELLTMLQEAIQTGKQLSDNQITLGNKVMVYVSCCLAGRAYPIGNIPHDNAYSVKEQVFKCLTTRHSANRKPNEPIYPHLRTLLHFDTREFLNVLAMAFEEPEFHRNESIWRRQDVVDILLDIMHQSHDFSPTQVGSLFTFLARQMAKHETTIIVNRSMFEQVLEYLTSTSEESRHEEREQALLELHSAGGLQYYDETRLLQQAEKAQFFRVCELLYEKRREYNKIVSCYLQDPTRKLHIFSFVSQVMLNKDLSASEKEGVEVEVLKNVEEMIDIDNAKTARLIYQHFPLLVGQVTSQLQDNPKCQFYFLQGIFEYRENLMSRTTASAIATRDETELDPSLLEKYIDLMCLFAPNQVYNFIKGNEDYRLDETLEIVKKHNILDAAAFLLEKLGRAQEAFSIMLQNLEVRIDEVMQLLIQGRSQSEAGSLEISWSGLQATLFILIQFCQRNSSRMSVNEREHLWFQLLESMMAPQRKLPPDTSSEYVEAFKDVTRHLLNSMMGYIKLPTILQKIIKDPTYNTSKFSEIRDLLLGMLDTYNYEKTLLTTTNNLLNADLHQQLFHLRLAANRGFVAHGNNCSLCQQTYNELANTEDIPVVLFRCGHSYHTSCLRTAEQLVPPSPGPKGAASVEEWTCHLCQRKQKKVPIMQRRISMRETGAGTTASILPTFSAQRPVVKGKVSLDPQQLQALDRLRQIHRTGSRLAMLAELSKSDSKMKGTHYSSEQSFLQREDFALRLAPPRVKT